MLFWYLVHTKPRQEQRAQDNLQRQGFSCYLPMCTVERLRQRMLAAVPEPLFPRYLFIQLASGPMAASWTPIRSTQGVSRLVSFGNEPARVDEALIDLLRLREQTTIDPLKRRFEVGERVEITAGPFAGIDAVFAMQEGESRAIVLIELLGKKAHLPLDHDCLRKVA